MNVKPEDIRAVLDLIEEDNLEVARERYPAAYRYVATYLLMANDAAVAHLRGERKQCGGGTTLKVYLIQLVLIVLIAISVFLLVARQ